MTMKRIAQFEKVSLDNFVTAMAKLGVDSSVATKSYQNLPLPTRATKGSAGYDFFAPLDIVLSPQQTITVPTGIRAKIDDGYVLQLFPRSGLGFKFRLQLDNTVGIIDADYYNSDNEGHIYCKITNDTKQNKTLMVAQNTGFCQGIFLQFGITIDDNATEQRTGGMGSTTKQR